MSVRDTSLEVIARQGNSHIAMDSPLNPIAATRALVPQSPPADPETPQRTPPKQDADLSVKTRNDLKALLPDSDSEPGEDVDLMDLTLDEPPGADKPFRNDKPATGTQPASNVQKSTHIDGVPVAAIFSGNQKHIRGPVLYELAKEYEFQEMATKINENRTSKLVDKNTLRQRLTCYKRKCVQEGGDQYAFEYELNEARRRRSNAHRKPAESLKGKKGRKVGNTTGKDDDDNDHHHHNKYQDGGGDDDKPTHLKSLGRAILPKKPRGNPPLSNIHQTPKPAPNPQSFQTITTLPSKYKHQQGPIRPPTRPPIIPPTNQALFARDPEQPESQNPYDLARGFSWDWEEMAKLSSAVQPPAYHGPKATAKDLRERREVRGGGGYDHLAAKRTGASHVRVARELEEAEEMDWRGNWMGARRRDHRGGVPVEWWNGMDGMGGMHEEIGPDVHEDFGWSSKREGGKQGGESGPVSRQRQLALSIYEALG